MHSKNTLISLRNVSVEFDGTRVLDKINLDIGDKEFVTLLGPSGCGKTTTLRIIGGFVEPTEGDVFFDGKKINGLPPHKRHVNTVFQRYALFPHLNVYENVEFGLKISKVPEEERRKRVKEMLALVNLRGFELREVGSLSADSSSGRDSKGARKPSARASFGRAAGRARLKAQKGNADRA